MGYLGLWVQLRFWTRFESRFSFILEWFLDVFWTPLGVSWAFRRGETLLSNRNERGAQAKRTFGPCGILGVPRGTPLGVPCVSFCRAVVLIGVLLEMSVSCRRNVHFEASCDPLAPMGALCVTVGSKFTAFLQGFREMCLLVAFWVFWADFARLWVTLGALWLNFG